MIKKKKNRDVAQLYRISRVSLNESDVGPYNGCVKFKLNEKMMISSYGK